MRIEPEISAVEIVLLGDFNPAIFSPAWFVLHDLLPANAATAADLQVSHPQITAFSSDWLHLEVTTERFQIGTVLAPYIRVRDLVARVFGEHLHHTPLTAFGINRRVHFRLRSRGERDRIGRALAPVEPWGGWSQELGLGGEFGGMTSLTMSQLRPGGRPWGGRINITVEPSNRIAADGFGVYVGINDHYDIVSPAEPGTAERLIGVLEQHFDASLRQSDSIVDHLMNLAMNRET